MLFKKTYLIKISFFTPSELIKWRVKTILDKEPETISWINEFKDRSIFGI